MSDQIELFEQEPEMDEEYLEYNGEDDCLLLEPREYYDQAIIGRAYASDNFVYDAEKVVEITSIIHEISMEEAWEFFEYNIAGSRGERYPEYIYVGQLDPESSKTPTLDDL